jgi:cadmium resistance protein CadD (predicted permease)
MMFFSSLTFSVRQVILGQYIGIGLLVAISALGSLISLIIPTYIIGLLGIAPIVIGVKKLVTLRKKNECNSKSKEIARDKMNKLAFAAVAAVTFSNGGDNIGVYTPLFARYSTASHLKSQMVRCFYFRVYVLSETAGRILYLHIHVKHSVVFLLRENRSDS